jgi:hypothetical protein
MADKSFTNSPSVLAVYSGQQCIGHVIRRGRAGIEAFDIEGQSVGLFTTMHDAMTAVSSKSREVADVA